MAKTMRNVVIACIALIAIAAGLSVLVLTGGCSNSASDPLAQTRADLVNAALDATGVKDRLDTELRAHAGELAEQYGVPAEMADAVVDTINVKEWQAVPLPEDAVETARFTVDADGTPIEITTYEDTSIVTLGAYGQEATFEAPESAQPYTPFLRYLGDLQSS